MTEAATAPANTAVPRPPMPKLLLAALLLAATVFVYGLGMAMGGHEWQKAGRFQPGIALIVGAFLLAIPTGLMYLSYCHGWYQRGLQPTAST